LVEAGGLMKFGEEKLYAKLLILLMIGPDKAQRQISLPTLAERGKRDELAANTTAILASLE
jgi:hypothetical protein